MPHVECSCADEVAVADHLLLQESQSPRVHSRISTSMMSAIRRLGLTLQADSLCFGDVFVTGPFEARLFGKFKSSSHQFSGCLLGRLRGLAALPQQRTIEGGVIRSLLETSAHFVFSYYVGILLGKGLSRLDIGGEHQTNAKLMTAVAAAVGAIRGFSASWLGSLGNVQEGCKGAASGALFGAIQGHYGERWTVIRVLQQSLAGALASSLHHGAFSMGLRRSLLLSSLTYIAAGTRAYECANSSIVPRQLGLGPGVLGSPGKIAGERINAQQFSIVNRGRSIQQSLRLGTFNRDLMHYLRSRYRGPDVHPEEQEVFGLFQGDPGRLFGYTYPPGGFVDRVVESFAGIHDFLNHPWFYNADGTSHYFLNRNTPLTRRLGATINAVNVIVALPVGLSALVPTYMYPYLTQFAKSRRSLSL